MSSGLPKKRWYFIAGLLAITLLYIVYYLYFIYGLSREIPLRLRHIVKFLFILTAYGIGNFTLKRYTVGWMMRIWHGVYLVSLLLLVLFGAYDWGIARTPFSLRIIADDLQEFLISPILYVAMGILRKSLVKEGAD
ncbi:hypothetical protein ACX0G9_08595 [Flavitalea flava]